MGPASYSLTKDEKQNRSELEGKTDTGHGIMVYVKEECYRN